MRPSRYSYLLLEVDGGIAGITINQPDDANRWAPGEEWEISSVAGDLAADADVRAVVLTGAGDSFCGGSHHANEAFNPIEFHCRYAALFGAWVELDKPVVVPLNGPAVGSGLTLATLGDIIVMERHVSISDVHVLAGAVSATGAYLWPPAVGLIAAKRYLLTGDPPAGRRGLPNRDRQRMVATGASLPRAVELAERLAALPANAVHGTKRAVNQRLRHKRLSGPRERAGPRVHEPARRRYGLCRAGIGRRIRVDIGF